MILNSYQALVDLYQPKIDEFEQKGKSLGSEIAEIENQLQEADQHRNEIDERDFHKKVAAVAIGIIAVVATTLLAIGSIAMPALIPAAVGSFGVALFCYLYFQSLQEASTSIKNYLTEDEQKEYAKKLSDKTFIELHVNKAKERLKANQRVDHVHPNYGGYLQQHHQKYIDDYNEWSQEFDRLITT